MIKLSIIIPVYNTEKYLHRCIESVLRQKKEWLELIIVDDGSNDVCADPFCTFIDPISFFCFMLIARITYYFIL